MGDEPTGALDSKTALSILKLLRTLCRKYNKTIVLVTHDHDLAEQSDRIVQLKDGAIIGDTLNNTIEETTGDVHGA